MRLEAFAQTDVGNIKKVNEDSYYTDEQRRIFVVADGVSGRSAGEVASKTIVDHIRDHGDELVELLTQGDPLEDDEHRELVIAHLTKLVQEGNTQVYQLGKQPEYGVGMATTVVALVLGEDAGFVAHVGDSRVYLQREDKIFRITEDHTYAEMLRKQQEEGMEIPAGINKRFAHVLTRSIGGRPHVEVDVVFFELQHEDRFLLCSDGLTDYLTGADILDYAQKEHGEALVSTLVEQAKVRGGHDNITAVYVVLSPAGADTIPTPDKRMDTMQKVSFLGNVTLFQDLSRVELLRMMRVVYEQSYAPQEVVVSRGQRSRAIHIIVSGEVRITREGREIATLGRGEHFGELSLFDTAISTVDVLCSQETLLLAIPLQRFQHLIRDELQLGNKLLWNLLRQLARNMERMNERVANEE